MAATQTGKTRSTSRKTPPTMAKVTAKAPKVTLRKKKTTAPAITPQDWHQMVATAAYLRAEARGFVGGSAEQDWLDAEAELMAKVGGTPSA